MVDEDSRKRSGKTLHERVDEGLEGASSEEVKEYLEQLRTSWREAESFNRRNMTLAMVAVVIFELATRKSISEVSLLSIKITAIPALIFVLPVFVAYLYVANIIHVTHIELLRDIYREVFRIKRPKQYFPGPGGAGNASRKYR